MTNCRKSTEGAADDTVLGMLRRANAVHFVEAAKLAHDRNAGYSYLLDRGLYVRYRQAFGFESVEFSRARRALALCFMAAMVEAGDA
jgi:hypothetical protein